MACDNPAMASIMAEGDVLSGILDTGRSEAGIPICLRLSILDFETRNWEFGIYGCELISPVVIN